ncbi:hypothetical protein [Streptomyces sp. NPDC056683]
MDAATRIRPDALRILLDLLLAGRRMARASLCSSLPAFCKMFISAV